MNYGDRFRAGERISTGFVESAINQIVDKRFDKRQSMRWTPRGTHLLLQTRTRVLNNDICPTRASCHNQNRAVQRSLLKVIEKMDFRPPKAAAKRSCGIVSV